MQKKEVRTALRMSGKVMKSILLSISIKITYNAVSLCIHKHISIK